MLKRAARKFITKQQAEFKRFQAMLANLYIDNSDLVFSMEQMQNMTNRGKVAHEQHFVGDIYNDPATLLIIDHQGAADNASAYLHHGSNEGLLAIARKIVTTQVAEIQALADWLKVNRRYCAPLAYV